MTKYLLRCSHHQYVRVSDVIHNITPFSGGTPTSHILPQLPVIQHTFPSLFQPGHHVCHLHALYTSQLESLHFPKGLLQLDDLSFDAITLLGENSEAVNLRYD